MDTLTVVIAAGMLVLAALVWAVEMYNRLVRQRNQVRSSWAQIKVQLKRRCDLVPNLVAVVRGYARHERETLEAVIAARGGAIKAGSSVSDRSDAENVLSQALGRLFALSEAYPDLKANQNFAQLQRELVATEDKIAYARQFYNLAVLTLSNTVHSIPTNLVAAAVRITAPPYFQADDRGPVRVEF